jgi:amino acid adenylation domain-containing protein
MPSTRTAGRNVTSRPVLKAIAGHAEMAGASRAISDARRSCTYAELTELIDRWAGALASRGAQRGSLVGIAMDRSFASLVGMLSVVRTGAAYVPLDLTAPVDRNAAIVRDSGLSLLIADGPSPTIDTLPSKARVAVSQLDANATAFREPHDPAPDDAFYVAYTSGSTGKPRGVTVTHGNIAWYTGMMPGAFDRRASDRFAVTTPFAFATSVRQTFVPLTLGAHTSVATAAQASDARELLEFVKRERITAWEVVPSMLRACVDLLRLMPESDRRSLLDNSLRQVGCIGEPLPVATVRDWLELGGRGNFTNSYGQSEASGLAVWPIDDATLQSGGIVPAGRPTPGNAIRIVDAEHRQVVDGETGEIVVEGPAVALGYRESRDNDGRFSVAPTGARTFRTGDLGRWRSDGALEVLGRLDDQLKVRGVRVDPFEVEAVLRSHASVRSAAVAVHQRNGEGVLVAYLCCVHEPPSAAEFRTLLRTRLTGPMVPSVYVHVAELPYTATGKLDRRALVSPFIPDANGASSTQGAPAHSSIEQSITEVWKQVLGVSAVKPDDDFFELGGSSLSGAQVVERLEHDFGIRVTLTTLLNHPTLADLVRTLEANDTNRRDLKFFTFRSADTRPVLLFVPGLKGRAAGMFALSQRMAYTVYAIDAEHADLSGMSVKDVATKYASIALENHPGPYCVVGFSMGGVFAFETARALRDAGAEVTLLVLLDSIIPRTTAIPGATRALVAVEEYLSLIALRVSRSMRDPLYYVRKLIRPASWQEFRQSIRLALGDYSAKPLDVPTTFVRARMLPLVSGRMRVWKALTGKFTAHSIWADHNDLLTEPAVSRVAAIIEAGLAHRR